MKSAYQSFYQNKLKINENRLEIILETTYGIHLDKYYKRMNLKFRLRSLMKGRFGLHSNSRDVESIKEMSITIGFRT